MSSVVGWTRKELDSSGLGVEYTVDVTRENVNKETVMLL